MATLHDSMELESPDPEYEAMLRDIAREEAAERVLQRRLAAYVRDRSAHLQLDGTAKHLESQHIVASARAIAAHSRQLINESYRILREIEAVRDALFEPIDATFRGRRT